MGNKAYHEDIDKVHGFQEDILLSTTVPENQDEQDLPVNFRDPLPTV